MANFIFFPNTAFFRGQVWQIFFCTFVNRPSFFILFGLFFLYVSAVEVEKYIGRSRFLVLYGILLFAPIFTLTAWMFATGQSAPYFGNMELSIGFFIAFCTLYSSLHVCGIFPLKWIGIISYALWLLVLLSQHDWLSALVFTLVCAASFGYIRYLQYGGELPPIPHPVEFCRRPKFKVASLPSSLTNHPAAPHP